CPRARVASIRARPRAAGSPDTIEPNPAYTNGPAAMNPATVGSRAAAESGSTQGPVRCTLTGQSLGRSNSDGLMGSSVAVGDGIRALRRRTPSKRAVSSRASLNIDDAAEEAK